MPDRVCPGPVHGTPCIKEAVCIHSKKVYDSCKDKECIQDARVYLTRCSQEILDRATSVKPRRAELIWVYIDVEAVPFNKGFYTVDVKYYYSITCDAYFLVGRPYEITGLATFSKRVILYGSEGNVRVFSSAYQPGEDDVQLRERSNVPTAVVEAVEPILLAAKIVDRNCCCDGDNDSQSFPECVCKCFNDELVGGDDGRRLLVTIGQFSIIKLERDTQLLIPAYDFCVPEKECTGSAEDPCAIFEKFKFPVDEFFPPELRSALEQGSDKKCGC